jgi:hypothetical protein
LNNGKKSQFVPFKSWQNSPVCGYIWRLIFPILEMTTLALRGARFVLNEIWRTAPKKGP